MILEFGPDAPGEDELMPGMSEDGGEGPEAGDPEPDPIESLPKEPLDEPIDLEDIEEGGEDEEEFSEEEEEGEAEEAEEGAEGEEDAAAKKKKSKKKVDDDEEIANPDTKVPSEKVMMNALEWAFEGEEDITSELLQAFCQHALLLLEANRRMNLTAILDPKEVAAKHFLDSWRITRQVPLMATKVLDLGSGGGFPGIPVALAEPMCSMTLCESREKRAGFLEEAVKSLGARNLHVAHARAEEYLTKERVDTVLVRAVSSVRENIRTLRKVRHSLKDYVMLKAASWSREVRAAEREAERLGFKLDTVWEHELPGEMGSRAILVYRAPGGAGQ